MNRYIVFALLLTPSLAVAAPGHGDGVPWSTVFWQCFNLTILFSVIIYLVAKPTREFFSHRRASFLEAQQKSQSAKKAAEDQLTEIRNRLAQLESTKEESLARALGEASSMRDQLIKEAHEVAQRIRTEAQATVRMEVLRAQTELKDSFVRESVQAARTVLEKDIGSQDHQRLQEQFVNQLQAGAQ